MPNGTAIAIAIRRPNNVSSADAGSRLAISVMTGRPVESELPRLPCARSSA
jgi:hypothetical protein